MPYADKLFCVPAMVCFARLEREREREPYRGRLHPRLLLLRLLLLLPLHAHCFIVHVHLVNRNEHIFFSFASPNLQINKWWNNCVMRTCVGRAINMCVIVVDCFQTLGSSVINSMIGSRIIQLHHTAATPTTTTKGSFRFIPHMEIECNCWTRCSFERNTTRPNIIKSSTYINQCLPSISQMGSFADNGRSMLASLFFTSLVSPFGMVLNKWRQQQPQKNRTN